MSIEPHNARFQIGTRVMPAETKPIPKPKLSMAEDAALIRTRFRRTFGSFADYKEGEVSSNEKARLKAQAEREKDQDIAFAIISKANGMTARDVAAATNASYDKTLNVIRALFKAGKVKTDGRARAKKIWVKA